MVSAAAVFVLAAAVISAVVAVLMMMAAYGVRVKFQRSIQQGLHRVVRTAGHSGIKPDSSLGKRRFRAAADPSADQRVHTAHLQKSGQRPVSAPGRDHRLGGFYRAVLYVVNLETGGVPEVLEHLPILVWNRNFHGENLLSIFFYCTPLSRESQCAGMLPECPQHLEKYSFL